MTQQLDDTIYEGRFTPPSRGYVDEQWFVEEDDAASRLGLRIEKLLHQERSEHQNIAVYDSGYFGKFLTLDDLIMFTERDEFVYHEMLVHVPLCSIPSPRSVLIIGGGDCGCLREVLRHPGIERVVQCDIDRRVTEVCAEHFAWVRQAINDPRAELVFTDGDAYVRQHPESFDLVIIDSTDPQGAALSLFNRTFYGAVARALRPGGVMTAQTESPHWSPAMVGAIYAEIGEAFAKVNAYMGAIPTYPSGSWSWAYAGKDRSHDEYFDRARAERVAEQTLYYNGDVHRAAFALPNFVRRALRGENPFERFDARHRRLVHHPFGKSTTS